VKSAWEDASCPADTETCLANEYEHEGWKDEIMPMANVTAIAGQGYGRSKHSRRSWDHRCAAEERDELPPLQVDHLVSSVFIRAVG
jgi:hypothetical protein